MHPNFLIAIFDDDLRATAFVSANPEASLEIIGFLAKAKEIQLSELIQSFTSKQPRIKRESIVQDGIALGLESVASGSLEFLAAIAEELRMAGFVVKIIPVILKSLLIYISVKLTKEQREKIIGEIVNLPPDIEQEAINDFQEILVNLGELKK